MGYNQTSIVSIVSFDLSVRYQISFCCLGLVRSYTPDLRCRRLQQVSSSVVFPCMSQTPFLMLYWTLLFDINCLTTDSSKTWTDKLQFVWTLDSCISSIHVFIKRLIKQLTTIYPNRFHRLVIGWLQEAPRKYILLLPILGSLDWLRQLCRWHWGPKAPQVGQRTHHGNLKPLDHGTPVVGKFIHGIQWTPIEKAHRSEKAIISHDHDDEDDSYLEVWIRPLQVSSCILAILYAGPQ